MSYLWNFFSKGEAITGKLKKAIEDPIEARCFLCSLLRGKLYTLKVKILSPRIQIGARLRARTSFIIRGPGKVIIGDDVTVDLSFLRTPTILTHRKESCVTIGNGTYLGGTRISCVDSITIGDEGLCGSSTIIDSDIIPTPSTVIDNRWLARYAAPIRIGKHFWAGTNAFILKGVELGDECVLGAGGLVYNKSFPDQSLLIGNPARRVGSTR